MRDFLIWIIFEKNESMIWPSWKFDEYFLAFCQNCQNRKNARTDLQDHSIESRFARLSPNSKFVLWKCSLYRLFWPQNREKTSFFKLWLAPKIGVFRKKGSERSSTPRSKPGLGGYHLSPNSTSKDTRNADFWDLKIWQISKNLEKFLSFFFLLWEKKNSKFFFGLISPKKWFWA